MALFAVRPPRGAPVVVADSVEQATPGLRERVDTLETGGSVRRSKAPAGITFAAPLKVASTLQLPGTYHHVAGVKLSLQAQSGLSVPLVTIGGLVPTPEAPLNGPITITTDRPLTVTGMELTLKQPGPLDNVDYFPINQTLKCGETFEVELPKSRKGMPLEQVECAWTASYSVPDPSGQTSDEGKPFYLDGVYADLFVVNDGVEQQIDRTKFVDESEIDNAHDLPGPTAASLRVKFFGRHAAADGHPITFQSLRVRYQSKAGASLKTTVAKTLGPGEQVEINLPPDLAERKIGRVEVRWTDMLSGTWQEPGFASGTLLLDGKASGEARSVQSPETEAFTGLDGARARKVGVLITGDRARIDWIEVHFE